MNIKIWWINILLVLVLFFVVHLSSSSIFAQACGTGGSCNFPRDASWTACTTYTIGNDACGRPQGEQFKYGTCVGGPSEGATCWQQQPCCQDPNGCGGSCAATCTPTSGTGSDSSCTVANGYIYTGACDTTTGSTCSGGTGGCKWCTAATHSFGWGCPPNPSSTVCQPYDGAAPAGWTNTTQQAGNCKACIVNTPTPGPTDTPAPASCAAGYNTPCGVCHNYSPWTSDASQTCTDAGNGCCKLTPNAPTPTPVVVVTTCNEGASCTPNMLCNSQSPGDAPLCSSGCAGAWCPGTCRCTSVTSYSPVCKNFRFYGSDNQSPGGGPSLAEAGTVRWDPSSGGFVVWGYFMSPDSYNVGTYRYEYSLDDGQSFQLLFSGSGDGARKWRMGDGGGWGTSPPVPAGVDAKIGSNRNFILRAYNDGYGPCYIKVSPTLSACTPYYSGCAPANSASPNCNGGFCSPPGVQPWNSCKTCLPLDTPIPTPYPTIFIQGNYQGDTGVTNNICSANFNVANPTYLSLGLTASNPKGVTSSCTKLNTSYSCTVAIDNQNTTGTSASQTLTLSASYAGSGYSPVTWRTGNACSAVNANSITVDVSSGASTVSNLDLFFKYSSLNWFKLSNTSFISRGDRNNYIPSTIQPFDTSTDQNGNRYDTGGKYVIDGTSPGLFSSSSDFNLGFIGSYSSPNFHIPSYSSRTSMTPAKYLAYIKARKAYKEISNLSQITGNGSYIYSGGDLTLTSAADFGSYNVVLVTSAQQSVTLSVNGSFTPSGNVAILADKIIFGSSLSEAQGIFIARAVTINGSSPPAADIGLKIYGNLISQTKLLNNRERLDNSRPSLFVVLNPGAYVALLPYLSTDTYEWKQLQ